MKKLPLMCVITAWLVLLPLPAWAEDVNAVVVWKTGGERLVVLLDEQPQVLFSGQDLLVRTAKGTVALPAGEVSRFTYEHVSVSGLAELRTGDVRIGLSDGRLRISALKSGSPVVLYGADGRLLASVAAGNDGMAVMDVHRFPSGTYIVKTSAGNFKINKP